MVLDHVADGARLIVKNASSLDPEILSHGDLYAFHIVTVPKGLQDRVGETEEDHVGDRSFSEIMINPEDRRLLETANQDPVQVLPRSQLTSKGLFANSPAALSAACFS